MAETQGHKRPRGTSVGQEERHHLPPGVGQGAARSTRSPLGSWPRVPAPSVTLT
eukprot:COSAG01_NODE_20938_length_926_cov_5.118501_1_plen_53_part_01